MQYPETEYCSFLFADGRRCRSPRMPTRTVCISHWKHDGQFNEDEAAIAELLTKAGLMSTPVQVNRAINTIFRLYTQGKIPHRKAALLTYQCHLSLCTMPRAGKRPLVGLPADEEIPAIPGLPGRVVEAQNALPPEGEPFHAEEPKPNGAQRANGAANK